MAESSAASAHAGVRGRLILLAGGTSAAGRAIAADLLAAGARVITVGSSTERLAEVAAALPGLDTELCDLTDEAAVGLLAARVHDSHGPIDGLIHLVGGWRGGGGLAGQTEADYRFLEAGFTALRHTSRAFDEDLRASDAGRLAIVSSTAVARPLAGGANYAAVKAASEAWTHAVAQGFAKSARDAGETLRAAAVIFRVATLAGLEPELATEVVRLWSEDPADLNGLVRTLQV